MTQFTRGMHGIGACSVCLRELSADLSDPAGELPRCSRAVMNEHIAVCERSDVTDEETGRLENPGTLPSPRTTTSWRLGEPGGRLSSPANVRCT